MFLSQLKTEQTQLSQPLLMHLFSTPLNGFLFDLLQFVKVFPSIGEPKTGLK